MVKPSKMILFQKSWTVHSWLFNPLSKKFQKEILHSRQNDRELAIVTF